MPLNSTLSENTTVVQTSSESPLQYDGGGCRLLGHAWGIIATVNVALVSLLFLVSKSNYPRRIADICFRNFRHIMFFYCFTSALISGGFIVLAVLCNFEWIWLLYLLAHTSLLVLLTYLLRRAYKLRLEKSSRTSTDVLRVSEGRVTDPAYRLLTESETEKQGKKKDRERRKERSKTAFAISKEDIELKERRRSSELPLASVQVEIGTPLLAIKFDETPLTHDPVDINLVEEPQTDCRLVTHQKYVEDEFTEMGLDQEGAPVDAWSRWVELLSVNAPRKIAEVLTQADRGFQKMELNIDKAFADVNCQHMTVKGKTYLLHQIAHAYRSTGKPEQSLAAANKAVTLPNDAESADTEMEILRLSLSCCATEACIDLLDLVQAVEHYQRVKKMFGSLEETAPNYETLGNRISNLKSSLKRFTTDKDKYVRSFGKDGGVLELMDCKIHLPEKCLTDEILIHASTSIESYGHGPPKKICVSPTLRLYPTTKLERPATVTLMTWLASSDPRSVHVYVKVTEESAWSPLRREDVSFSGSGLVEFNVTQFCKFCVGQDIDEAAIGTFWVESRLFYEPACKQMTNCIFPQCENFEKDVEMTMNQMGYKRACTAKYKFRAQVNDVFEVELVGIEEPTEAQPPAIEIFPITLEFLTEQVHHSQNFFMPSACENSIRFRFNHNIKQARSHELVKEETHKDTILLKTGSRPRRPVSQNPIMIAQNLLNDSYMSLTSKGSYSSLDVRLSREEEAVRRKRRRTDESDTGSDGD